MLTKSDFMISLDCPKHLWAHAHHRYHATDSNPIAPLLWDFGYTVEAEARHFLHAHILPNYIHSKDGEEADIFRWQASARDGLFTARTDALIFNQLTQTCDLYEIKSGTHLKAEYEYDIAFQSLIFEANFDMGHYYLLQPNKHYQRQGELDLENLFILTDLTETVKDLQPEVKSLRQIALTAKDAPDHHRLESCAHPKSCPCPDLCHPGLPEYSIYELPRISQKKLEELDTHRCQTIFDIPDYIELSQPQALMVRSAQSDEPVIDHQGIQEILANLTYPLYFLDYESFIFPIPQYDGFSPQQQLVFQYSLHTLSKPDGEPVHADHLCTQKHDPTADLLEKLQQAIHLPGSVIVWNKSFEASRNQEMAQRLPQYRPFLEAVNQHMFDLMDIFAKQLYVDYRFHGSASIKQILPILVPELSYKKLDIGNGSAAMIKWFEMVYGHPNPKAAEAIKQNLLKYCELDTLAMVKIWEKLRDLKNS